MTKRIFLAFLILTLVVFSLEARPKGERADINFKGKYLFGPAVSIPDFTELSCRVCGIEEETPTGSYQSVAFDLTIGADSGSADGTNPKYIGTAMFNLLGADLTASKDANYLGGVIGAYSITGTKRTTYPAGAILGQITDGVTQADGAFVAYIDGDSATTTAGAAYKVRNNNSTAASGFDFGVDLQDAAHDGYAAVDKDFYLKAPMRLVSDVVFIVGTACTSGTTGDNIAGPGSLCFDTAGSKLYINTGAIDNPTWTVVGTQS